MFGVGDLIHMIITLCFTVNCLILMGMFGSTPSKSLRPLFSKSLLPGLLLLAGLGLFLETAGLFLSSKVRSLTVNGILKCQDIAARATFVALRECPKDTSLIHMCATGPCNTE